MSAQTLRDLGIWIDGYDFTGLSNECSPEFTAEAPETTTFRPRGGYRTRAAGGLKTSSLSMGGWVDYLDPAAGLIEQAQLATDASVMLIPGGFLPGAVAYIMPVLKSGLSKGSSVGELLGWSWASEGQGKPNRAQVMDVRHNVTSLTRTGGRNFGMVPVGQNLEVWIHAERIGTGNLQIQLGSTVAGTGTPTSRGAAQTITDTGLVKLIFPGDAAVTDAYWHLSYTPGANGDWDVAAAAFFDAQMVIVAPITPVVPPTPATHTLLAGLSADAIPGASELTQSPDSGTAGHFTFQPFTDMHVLFGRDDSQGDITSVVDSADPTNQNQIGGWTKYGSTVDVGGTDIAVWVSDQLLTFTSARTLEVS